MIKLKGLEVSCDRFRLGLWLFTGGPNVCGWAVNSKVEKAWRHWIVWARRGGLRAQSLWELFLFKKKDSAIGASRWAWSELGELRLRKEELSGGRAGHWVNSRVEFLVQRRELKLSKDIGQWVAWKCGWIGTYTSAKWGSIGYFPEVESNTHSL